MGTCLICIEECDTMLHCGHYYHNACLKTWFADNKFKIVCCYCKTALNSSESIKVTDSKTNKYSAIILNLITILCEFIKYCINI
jgi:hypothetical protein